MESTSLVSESDGTAITEKEMDSCFDDGKLKLTEFHDLLVMKRGFDPEKWGKYPCINHLTDGSDRETVNKAMEVVDKKFTKVKEAFIVDEANIAMKIGYCAAFTTYCCLCTAFTSCCIGPYFMKQYSEEMVDRNETYKNDLVTEMTKEE